MIVPTRESLFVVPVHWRRKEDFVVGRELRSAEQWEKGLRRGDGKRVNHHSVETL